ncbi:XisI protein [Rippkaea orientalis PCC 8801]|uniref:XisI protein n=1 Tax=Rippkaea orientalis (strain PCC 8801 / RF-1) TaxID=41431 RepID=B7K507_RIPO1|nr:XisI protein [Rippkaea orientalis]ACK66663.1 XisI protein [Rippkaea orientalis PCC 8801]
MATLEKIELYRQYIQKLLTEHSQVIWDKRIQAQTIFDVKNDHYQLVYVGWKGAKRVYGVVLHLDIIDEKIWIQQDGTEVGIANKLVELGVPKKDIVLGFDPPMMRQYTEFSVG